MSEFNAKDAAKRANHSENANALARDLLSALSLLKRTGEAARQVRGFLPAEDTLIQRLSPEWRAATAELDAVLADLRRAGVLEDEPDA